MTEARHHIMVVDDEPVNLRIMEKLLNKENYDVLLIDSGEECLAKLDEFKPEIVLLDIIMPGMDGYEVCSMIKNNPAYKNTHVIFISAKDSFDDRIKGYAYGASDYFVKPFLHDELLIKIEKFLNFIETSSVTEENIKNATQVAMKAMTNAGEIGQVLRFLQDSYTASSFSDIARKLLKTTSDLGLECTVQLRGTNEVITLTEQGVSSPLEESILSKAKDKGRFYDNRDKTLVNYASVSLLIKNMPVDNPERYGEIKDFVCYLLDGVEARIIGLNNEHLLAQQTSYLQHVIQSASESFAKLSQDMHQLRVSGATIFEDMMEKMDALIPRLGLEEAQENAILGISEEGVAKTNALFSNHLQVDSQFVELIDQLKKVCVSGQSAHPSDTAILRQQQIN